MLSYKYLHRIFNKTTSICGILKNYNNRILSKATSIDRFKTPDISLLSDKECNEKTLAVRNKHKPKTYYAFNFTQIIYLKAFNC